MAQTTVFLVLAALICLVQALPTQAESLASKPYSLFQVGISPAAPEVDLCNTCNQLDGAVINELLNYILNAGVVGGCEKLCANLNGTIARDTCDLVCAYVGIKAFAEAIESADLDPIYFCQQLKFCPVDDDGAATITSLVVHPSEGPAGTKFDAKLSVVVTNHTGAGEFRFTVYGGPGGDSGASSLFPELAPGAYDVKLKVNTEATTDPDGFPIVWDAGVYTVGGVFCMGECGSQKPHSKLFGSENATFIITA